MGSWVLSDDVANSTTSRINLKAADVCKIISACKTAGVNKLSFGMLSLEFMNMSPVNIPLYSSPDPVTPVLPGQAEPELSELQIIDHNARMGDEAMDMLSITDPVAFEQAIRDGELDES